MAFSLTRRSILQSGSAAAVTTVASSAVHNIARAQTNDGEAYWELVRRQFVFPESTVPMNCANLCPTFQAVAEKASAMSRVIDYDVSFNNRAQFNDTLKASRAKVAGLHET